MKTFSTLLLLLFLTSPAFGGDLPLTVAGITLGKQYTEYEELTDAQTATPMSDALYLSEIKLADGAIAGIRGGSITFGNCSKPGRVLRVKLKFTDQSEDLYRELLRLFTKRFGKPGEWQGDPFNIVQSWQWEVRDGDEKLTFTLAHSKDLDFRPGVSIKMTMRSWMNEERECWSKKNPNHKDQLRASSKDLQLEDFVPH